MILKNKNYILLTILFSCFLVSIHHATLDSSEVISKTAMVASQDEYATDTGISVLKEGGNAIDAAVAVAYTMAVTHPRAGNIGGGGFMMIYHKETDQVYALDFREKAPKKAYRDLFLKEDGSVDNEKARFSIFSAGVPGTVAGLEAAHQRFGSISRERLLNDAIYFAENGFIVDSDQKKVLTKKVEFLTKDNQFKKHFYNKKKNSFSPKNKIVQKNLAKTLKSIQQQGKKGFYEGKVAENFVSFFEENKGLITLDDLKSYEPVWRKPIQGKYKGQYNIVSMPPPSSGGIAIIELLNIIEALDLENTKHNSVDYIHNIVEAMKYTYADRATHLGDQDFVSIPIEMLTSKEYAKSIANQISTKNITAIKAIKPDLFEDSESLETTHFSIIDKDGNIVSCTYTLNFAFGNGMIAGKTGVILNNEMDDFSAKPGSPNGFGLLGNEKNEIAPEKRMLSSMSPTIVFQNEKPFLITGSPGGSTIITSVLQIILNVIDYDMTIGQASSAARFHHQWFPDMIFMEEEHNPKNIEILKNKGFKIENRRLGITQSILVKDNSLFGKSDPRNISSSTKGY